MAAAATITGMLSGCALEGRDRSTYAGNAGLSNPRLVPWQPHAALDIDQFGNAGWVSIPFPADQRYVAVRAMPLDAPEVDSDSDTRPCYRATEARLGSGLDLLPTEEDALQPYHQRLLPGVGAGVFVFSTTAKDMHDADRLDLRIELIDCALGLAVNPTRFPDLPDQLRVDTAWEPKPNTGVTASIAVRILRAEDSGWGPLDEDPALAQAFTVAAERFADAGIELVVEAEASVPELGTLAYEVDMLGFSEVDAKVQELLVAPVEGTRFVPLVLVRCLELDDPAESTRHHPQGQVSRFPGSIADPATPSLTIVASGDCSGQEVELKLDPERYGLVIAHELGHYLGLLHSDATGDHLHTEADEQLMRSALVKDVETDDAWFSPTQAQVMWRHPDVVLSAAL